MEGLHLLKDILRENDLMCKLALKDAYYCTKMHIFASQYIPFSGVSKIPMGKLCEFLCLFFGLGAAP